MDVVVLCFQLSEICQGRSRWFETRFPLLTLTTLPKLKRYEACSNCHGLCREGDGGGLFSFPVRAALSVARTWRTSARSVMNWNQFILWTRTSIPCSPATSPASVCGSLLPKL